MRVSGTWMCAVLALVCGVARAQDEVPVKFPAAGVSLGGALGFGRVTNANPGDPGALRLALRGGFFQGASFPVAGTTRQLQGEFTAGYTFDHGLELFGAYRNASSTNPTGYPALIQAQGDLLVGLKASVPLFGGHVGGDLRFDLRNGVGADRPTFDASSVQARALWSNPGVTFGGAQLSYHFNLGVALGKSSDALRMDALQLFGTGLSGFHRVLASIGTLYEYGRINPFATVDFDLPLGLDSNLSAFDVGATRLALGARILAGAAGVVDVALDLGSGDGARGFARTAPYQLTLAYSFAFDSELYAPPPPAPPAPAPLPPTKGSISGTVQLIGKSQPIANAILTVEGSDLPPVATDASGRFTTLDLPPGPVTLNVSREGYKPTTFEARVAAGKIAPAEIHLEIEPPPPPPPAPPPPPPPPPAKGFLAGRVETGTGRANARVTLNGPVSQEIRTGSDGTFSVKVPPGTYDLVLAADGFYARSAQALVESDQVAVVVVTTAPMGARRLVSIEGDEVNVATPITLDERKPAPDAAAEPVLNELADLLVRNPGRRLLISVHSDPGKKGDDRKVWTELRAQALRKALLALGAPAERVEATGFGLEQPLKGAPAKSRRVELKLTRFAEPPPSLTPAAPIAPLAPAMLPEADPALTLPVLPSGDGFELPLP